MESPTIINLMRSMKVDCVIPLEEVHHSHKNISKLYRGRPEMLMMKMVNGRNVQCFRAGRVQILGRISDEEAESMRLEFIGKLRLIEKMQHAQITKMTVSNLVMSAQLKKNLYLRKIALTDSDVFHEIELFPAALIQKWHPIHIALFHTGKVILTGLKSVNQFYEIMSTLHDFLEKSHFFIQK